MRLIRRNLYKRKMSIVLKMENNIIKFNNIITVLTVISKNKKMSRNKNNELRMIRRRLI